MDRRRVNQLLVSAPFLLAACAVRGPQERHLNRLAFGSCLEQKVPSPILKSVRAYNPDVFLFLGDNVYGDVTSEKMVELKQAYTLLAKNTDFQALRRASEVHATWDDHDYGANDAGAGFPWQRQAEALFLDFWDVPADDARHHREGIYTVRMTGPPGRRVQIILLDTRYFRDDFRRSGKRRPKYVPDADPEKTMLGGAQWAWLEAELRKPADVHLLVSSIQILAEDHGWERWGHLPRERNRLFETIRRSGAKDVVLLSGDRHFGALYVHEHAIDYPLYELTSSSLNRPWREANEVDTRQIDPVYPAENFGTVDIDWVARRVTLGLRGLDGKAVRRLDIRLSSAAA